jgi:hypothetical protein
MISNWKKFRGLSGAERTMCIRAFLLLPLCALSLRVFGIRRLHNFLARLLPDNRIPLQHKSQILLWAYDTARMVQVAGRRYPFRITNCLTQSVTLWWLLCRHGIESNLRIGVRKEQDQLKAHAWVECQGFVLNDTFDVQNRYFPFKGSILADEANSS